MDDMTFDEAAFQETQERLDRILLQERRFTEDEKGEILLFKEPEQGRPYTLGGDTAGEGSDSFTVQVIDNITGEQMARLKWQSCDEDTYAKQVYCLGRYYNDALAAVETNFSTHPQKVLEYLHYPKLYVREIYDNYEGRLRKSFGFQTNGLTRPVLVATMQEFMRSNLHLVHDRDTLHEMLSFIRNEKGRAEAEQGEHDDLVMAYGIALMARASGQQRMDMPEEKKEKKAKWTADMWEDYRNASRKEKQYLLEKWGSPW